MKSFKFKVAQNTNFQIGYKGTIIFAHMQEKTKNGAICAIFLQYINSWIDYSAVASVTGASTEASTGASALGAAFLPARRVVFLAAALGVLSMFSL